MRYVTLHIRPDGRWFQHVDSLIARNPSLKHGPIHEIKLLADGTAVNLYEIHGDHRQVSAVYDGETASLFEETVTVDDVTYVLSHFEPSPVVSSLLETAATYPMVVDTPMHFVDRGLLQATVIADADTLQDAFADIQNTAAVTVEKTGEYRPTANRLYAELTDRQREILELALEMGYYDRPRRATYEDISSRLDCTATTVGDHLRKIEGYVLREIVPSTVGE